MQETNVTLQRVSALHASSHRASGRLSSTTELSELSYMMRSIVARIRLLKQTETSNSLMPKG